MSTSKSHFEELNAQADAVQKLLDLVYPDDAAPSDELKSYMVAMRSIVSSKIIKEFLPKLGIHQIAEVPALDEIDSSESMRIVQFLANLKRRMDNISKLAMGQLAANVDSPAPAGGGDMGTGSTSSDTGNEGGEGGEDNGGEGGDELEIPGF